MMRATLAVLAGLVVWVLVATVLDWLLRVAIPGYAAAEPLMHFTLPMMIARLAIPGALPTVVAGYASASIGPARRSVIAVLAILLFLVFLPAHYRYRALFPLWYHLVFLGSLLLLPWLGARLRRSRPFP
jgi:hypothetical protein